VEILKLKTEAQLAAAERLIAAALSPKAEERAGDIKVKVTAQSTSSDLNLPSAKTELQPKLDAATAARDHSAKKYAARNC
jgi:hypothetical protein